MALGAVRSGDLLGEKFWLGPLFRLGCAVGSASAHISGDPGSNHGLGDNFSLKLTQLGYICIISRERRHFYKFTKLYWFRSRYHAEQCFKSIIWDTVLGSIPKEEAVFGQCMGPVLNHELLGIWVTTDYNLQDQQRLANSMCYPFIALKPAFLSLLPVYKWKEFLQSVGRPWP